MGVLEIGGGLEFSLLLGPDAAFTHQSGHSLKAMTLAPGLEFGVNTRVAVGPALGLMNGFDLHQQQAVIAYPPALRPPEPSVIGVGGHIQHKAHAPNRISVTVVPDELILHLATARRCPELF